MSYLLPQRVDVVPHPFVVVCEGYNDACFVCALLKLKGITNCNVGCPSREGGHGMGKEAIPSYLRALKTSMDIGKANLHGVLVVADADDNKELSFKLLADALKDAEFMVPSEPFKIDGNPISTGVFLIPGRGRTGTLEHILWEAAVKKNPSLDRCVNAFSACVGSDIASCTNNQQVKMKMSAAVAMSCKDNPWTSLGLMWRDAGNPVPVDSECFSDLSDFLVAFTTSAI